MIRPPVPGCLRCRSRAVRVLATVLLAWCGPDALRCHAETALEKAASLRAAGQFDEALDVLRAESEKLKRADGDDSQLLLPVDDLTAEILIDQGAVEAAEPLLGKTIALRQRLVDAGQRDHGVGLGMSLLARVRLNTVAKRLPDAVASARHALTVCDKAAGPRSKEADLARKALTAAADALEGFLGPADNATLAAYDGAATTFASLGMYADAIEHRKKILACLAARDGVADAEVLAASERLCRLMMLAGRADEALPILGESLAPVTPANSPAAVAGLRLLGQLQLAADRLSAADASFKAALEATGTTAGVPTCDSSSDRLQRVLIAERRDIDASLPEWFEPELKLLAKATPAERAAAIAGLAVAGDILVAREQPAAAVEKLSLALVMAAALKPAAAEVMADVSGRLMAAHLAAGAAAAALKLGEPALATAERELGAGDARVSFLRVMLADAFWRAERIDRAEALIDEALNHDLPRPDIFWEQAVVGVCDRLATVDRQASLPERYVAARARQFGDSHPHVGMAWSLFGAAHLAAGDWTAAVDSFSRSIAVQQAGLGDEHPEVAASLTLLAHAERAAGEPAKAAATAARALAVWERIAGPDHPGSLAAADVLVSARLQAGDTSGVEELLTRLSAAESSADPVRRAGYLVRLADLSARRDKASAQERLHTAMMLPCWKPDAISRASDRQRLAFTAARAAYAYKVIGEPMRSEESLRKARSLALQAENSRQLLDQLEKLAADGAEPPAPSQPAG